MEIIRIVDLCKTYNLGKLNAVHALNGVSLSIKQGEAVAIMGASGSGKSTLLHSIGCLDVFDNGEYYISGKDVKCMSAKQLAQIRCEEIGFVLQDYGLIYSETVYDNISLPLMFGIKTAFSGIKLRVSQVMEQLSISELGKKKVRELSGGQKQRVAIARALVNDPKVILADEPTGALDSNTANEIMNVLLDLNKLGKTIIMVTHDINMANKMSRIINIADGKIV